MGGWSRVTAECLHQHLPILLIMDALKSLVSSKRKALEDDPIAVAKPNKYMRRGDIERLKEEMKAREAKEREEQREAETNSQRPSLVSFPYIVLESYRPYSPMENRPPHVPPPTRPTLTP